MSQVRSTTTEAVLRAAAEVFMDKGYQSATIRDIACAAGISKPTVYQYAESKQWLLETIVRRVCDELDASAQLVYGADAPPDIRFYWLIWVNVDLAIRYRTFYRVTLSEQADLSAQAREEFRKWAHMKTSNVRDLLLECDEQGTLTWQGDVTVAANLILSMLSSVHRWFRPGEPVTTEGLTDDISKLLASAVRPPADLGSWPRPAWENVERDQTRGAVTADN